MGDLNVHNRAWLRYSSSRTSPEGTLLEEVCRELSLRQLVREPTREENLLDLALTNSEEVTCRVLPRVADHKILEVSLNLPVPREELVQRKVWNFTKARWDDLVEELGKVDWDCLDVLSPDNGAQLLTDRVLQLLDK